MAQIGRTASTVVSYTLQISAGMFSNLIRPHLAHRWHY